MFRSVGLSGVPGRLYLHGMPGKNGGWAGFIAGLIGLGIDAVVCLTPQDEIERGSPPYARAIANGALPSLWMEFPIPDYGAPDDRKGYARFVGRVAQLLRDGNAVLVHCNGGVGRTGTFAICLFIALGVPSDRAREAVGAAGSMPEVGEQEGLIAWYEDYLRGSGKI